MTTSTDQGSATAAPPPTVEYHYITTVQTPRGSIETREGTLTAPPGTTRQQCYLHLHAQLVEECGASLAFLFFSLEPNQL